jgi:hypothetical protein
MKSGIKMRTIYVKDCVYLKPAELAKVPEAQSVQKDAPAARY